ncbi:MAG TPA: hypothetical protein VL325_05835, partial [Pyrinomonadaceae bacterium]|nr:hypothetical protein [Pyrinomonadaceae bacterium]
MSEEKDKVEAIRTTFTTEFERFADLSLNGIALSEAEVLLREVGELRIKHSGKKSAIADAKKLIGKVAPEERGDFGQFVQSVEKDIVSSLESVEAKLNEFIINAKIERERLDVTLPG